MTYRACSRKKRNAMAVVGAYLMTIASADAGEAPADGRIGYVLTDYAWAIYQTADGKRECPEGLNDGPREQFKILFPDDGIKRKLIDAQLRRENEQWFPDSEPEQLPFKEAKSDVSYGLNLDATIGAEDFTSPEGEKGIDNEMYRALGCISSYRGPDGFYYSFTNKFMQQYVYGRVVIELTNVDSLVNDDSVIVTTYRGTEQLMSDATGNGFLPGGTQGIEDRWGREFIYRFPGKIVDGILTTNPGDWTFPALTAGNNAPMQKILGAVFHLRLTPQRAEGVIGGYTDIDAFIHQMRTAWSTHQQGYGQVSAQSLYKALSRLADGYPNRATGKNTGISSALNVNFVQVFVRHPTKEIAMTPLPLEQRAALRRNVRARAIEEE